MRIFYRQSKLFGLFILGLLLLSGCAAMHGLREDPKVSIADIKIQDVKAMEGAFLITLRMLNPNNVPLDLHAINCDLEMGGRHFASGIANSTLSVPAYGTQLIPVTVYASMLDIVASVADLMHTSGMTLSEGKPLSYTLQGTISVSTQGYQKEIPFKSTGEISTKGLTLPR